MVKEDYMRKKIHVKRLKRAFTDSGENFLIYISSALCIQGTGLKPVEHTEMK